MEKGKHIAAESFKALSTKLKSAMQAGGVANAINYCNLAASPLTDSLSNQYNVDIKRTSLKFRNPNNRPDPEEILVLQDFQKMLDENGVAEPLVKQNDKENPIFYAPILTSEACLSCHGNLGAELKNDVYALIESKYPADLAIGYNAGELRGMWRITFNENQ
jgi:hypothetical protein